MRTKEWGQGFWHRNLAMQRPVAYYSIQLDPVARGTVPCLRAVVATVELVKHSRGLILGHPLTLRVPYNVFAILLKSQNQAFTQQSLAQYELFTSDHISFELCTILNPATLPPTNQSEDVIHDCPYLVQDAELPRPDLNNVPLQNPDFKLFTAGSSYIKSVRGNNCLPL